jgi:hypothetical protein
MGSLIAYLVANYHSFEARCVDGCCVPLAAIRILVDKSVNRIWRTGKYKRRHAILDPCHVQEQVGDCAHQGRDAHEPPDCDA